MGTDIPMLHNHTMDKMLYMFPLIMAQEDILG